MKYTYRITDYPDGRSGFHVGTFDFYDDVISEVEWLGYMQRVPAPATEDTPHAQVDIYTVAEDGSEEHEDVIYYVKP